jgi:putative sigma-54 modulation protein
MEDPMQIDIQACNFLLTDALRSHAEQRLRFALTCCSDRIQRVVMQLSDINGPRGGADKCCHLHVVLAGLPDVVVDDIEADLYIAIDRATDRAGRTVVRQIGRQQTLLKQGRPLVSNVQ